MSPSTAGAPEDCLLDIIAPPDMAAESGSALGGCGLALIIMAPADGAPLAVTGARRESATVTGLGLYSSGSRRSKLRTLGRSLNAMYGCSG